MTPKEKTFLMRLSEEERDELEKAATIAGFKNISDYVRYYTIGEGRHIREDIQKILKKLDIK